MNFHDRLKEARRKSGLTQQQVAEKIGVAKSAYAGYESGFREPDVLKIQKIIETLKTTSAYLLGDRAQSTERTIAVSKEEQQLLASFRILDEHGRSVIFALLEEEVRRINELSSINQRTEMIVYRFPAAAGIPMYAEDDSYERLTFYTSQIPSGADFGIRISGDSMEPTIPADTVVFVRKVTDLRSGDIGIFMLDDEAVCKRFHLDDRGIHLLSDNNFYEPIQVNGIQRFTITGKVLGYK